MTTDAPFGRRVAPRRRALGAALLALIVLGAAGLAVVLSRSGRAPADAAGHDHTAMAGRDTGPARAVELSEADRRRIGVTFAVAEVGPLEREVRTAAVVTPDETRLTTVTVRVEGFVERLFANYTGRAVRRGDPLFTLYSPMLLAAEQEYLLARNLAARGGADAGALVSAARRRLALAGVPESELVRLERTGEAASTVPILAPAGGILLEKQVLEGQRVMPGDLLFRIADLSVVWLEGEVYERDLPAVRQGLEVRAGFEGLPGEERVGQIAFVYPTVNTQTRTARIRVSMANPGLALKPGMYATIRFRSGGAAVLTIPRSAVLVTGERNLVFFKAPDGGFVPRDVVLGLATDERIQVLSGLAAGDSIVASATFLLDAESNLRTSLGGMGDMPGMDVRAPTPASPAPVRKPAPPPEGHDAHQGH